MPTAATSEIDDIFGSSSGSKNAQKRNTGSQPVTLPSARALASTDQSKPDKKKRKKQNPEVLVPNAVAATADLDESSKEKKKKKKKSSKSTMGGEEEAGERSEPIVEPSDPPPTKVSKKRSAPETVVDPSVRIEAAVKASTKKRRIESINDEGGSDSRSTMEGRMYIRQEDADEERFRDSRGTGPRKLFNSR